MPCAAVFLSTVIFCLANAISASLPASRGITVRKAMQALEEEGVVTRARGYGTQINNIFEYSLKEARGFSQQVVLRGKKNRIRYGLTNAW
ncbi:gntR family transcriptional regulator [Salmonella enterica subsp. enterica]|uniref:GntR family transcriptional regulator n=1 Tax=Salmonella enterica I TaxID=59201 RepID=A0A447U074_SALET|nr:gntR family transcriptional regulator [Salmonella enterica subsp. enterica]